MGATWRSNTAVLFPGQGMQRRGMGVALFGAYAEFFDLAESIVGFSIRRFFLDAPAERFRDTRYVQPALYTVNALGYRRYLEEGRDPPAFLAGHSLGELNALQASGAFDFETGLRLVQKRAQLMATCAGGGMAAVLGLTAEEVLNVLAANRFNDLSIANDNSDLQVVIAGPLGDIREAEDVFYKSDAMKYVVLRVNGAFHTKYMASASDEFARYLRSISFSPPTVTVMSNTWSVPYDVSSIGSTLAEHIVRPVRWRQSVAYMRTKGVDDFIEVGDGSALLDMVRNSAGST